MAVRLDKEPVTPSAVKAGHGPVNLAKQDVTSGPFAGAPPRPTPSGGGPPALSHSGRRGRAGHHSPGAKPRHQFGRVALIAGFLAGALAAGLVGGAVANHRGNSAQTARAELAKARADLGEAGGELATARQEEVSTQAELDSANDQLAELQARADDVADREDALDTQEGEARRRAAELDTREQQLAARETTVAKREAALKSVDDGTWVVGRDIKPGTWRAFADDTGCTWSTSDGRSGQGDGTFHDMKVPLAVGQTFTVHGCTMWDVYGW